MSWTIEDSKLIYGIGKSDLNFLDISKEGDLLIKIQDHTISINEIIEKLGSKLDTQNFSNSSFTLRLPQLISSQVNKITEVFQSNMDSKNYSGLFRPLYPIKVNHRKEKIRTILSSSKNYGLEVGTKAELQLSLNELSLNKDRIIACNGVKECAYVEIIKKAIDDDYNLFVSIESMDELKLCLDKLDHKKLHLILRLKPYVLLKGHWGLTSGRNSKFGLTINDLIQVTIYLKDKNLTSLVHGIHAHPGSQMLEIESIQEFVKFLVNCYIQLYQQGFTNLMSIDFGGGLPINYEGNLNDKLFFNYASIIVKTLTDELNSSKIPQPTILIEAGRALTALGSLIIIRPLELRHSYPSSKESLKEDIGDEINDINNISALIDFWHNLHSTGVTQLNFEDLNRHETKLIIYKKLLRKKLIEFSNYEEYTSNADLQNLMTADYFILGNFSVFSSISDHILVNQYFPVLLSKDLNLQPETLVRLVDITCDSDGEISSYVTKFSNKSLFTKDKFPLTTRKKQFWKGFPVPKLSSILDSYVIIPLTGAYQDVIKFDYNLIGKLVDVQLILTSNNHWQLNITKQEQSIDDILEDAGYIIDESNNAI